MSTHAIPIARNPRNYDNFRKHNTTTSTIQMIRTRAQKETDNGRERTFRKVTDKLNHLVRLDDPI